MLEPELGAHLEVRLAAPAARGGPGSADGSLTLMGGNFSGRGGGWSSVELELRERAVLSFRGLDAGFSWTLMSGIETHHADTRMGIELEPGEDRLLDLELLRGVAVSGTVLDPDGEPLAGAEVSAGGGQPWFGGRGGREAETDAEGRFALVAVQPGELTLEASLDGWLDGESDELDTVDGDELEGVVIVLDRGLAIAGEVRYADGRPAVGARVQVQSRRRGNPFGGPPGFGGSGMQTAGRADAGEGGRFSVTGLTEGAFTVRAAVEDEALGARRAVLQGVRAGTTDLVLELAAPAALVGRVVDDLGEPIAAFDLAVDSTDAGGPRERQSFEDADGGFAFLGAGPGEWTVEARAEGHVQLDEALVVLPREAPLELVLPRRASLAGRVVDPLGAPVAGAEVLVQDGRANPNPWMGGRGPRTETDADGRFELEDLVPGSLGLTARSEDWADSEELALELAPGEVREDVVLELREGGRIVGRVSTPEGDPSPDRRVTWGSNAMGFGSRDETRTDAAGEFRFEHVTPGEWAVTAAPSFAEMGERMQGRDTNDQTAWVEVMGELVTETVEVVDGEEVEVLLGGEPKRPVRIFGTVTRGGDPLAGAQVYAVSEGSAVFQGMKASVAAEDGSFEVVVDRPGPHVVSAQLGSSGVESLVDVPREDELRVDLAIPTARIEGAVRRPDGEPAVGVRLNLQREDGLGRIRWAGDQTTTDELGAYAFEDLAAGRYTVRANVSGWTGSSEEQWGTAARAGVVVAEDAVTAGVDFELAEAGVIAGVVRGPEGQPVGGASVFVSDAAGLFVARVSGTVTDGAGRFEQTGLAPGTYSLTVRGEALAGDALAAATVESGETTEVELTVETGTMLLVTIEDPEGVLRRARIEVLDGEGRDLGSLLTLQAVQALFNSGASSTEQRLGPVPPGRYTVRATTAEGLVADRRVTIRARDEEKRVRLKLD